MSPSIVILFGGTSDERRVSVATAQNVAEALPEAKLCFEDPQGNFFDCQRSHVLAHPQAFVSDYLPITKPLASSFSEALGGRDWQASVFLLALHGGEGENGVMQKEFEKRKIAFTGSGSVASANAFNKCEAKRIVKKVGIFGLSEEEVESSNTARVIEVTSRFLREHGELILKPVSGGSSIGLFRVKNAQETARVARSLAELPNCFYLIEPFKVGRELTVGVVDDETKVFALPPSEVITAQGHDFDYEGKYLGKGSQEITPAQITEKQTRASQQIAVKAHQALEAFGYTRTDLILSGDEITYLETNTLPGMTKASFIPQQLAAGNIPFEKFLRTQVRLAWKRARKAIDA